MAPCERPYCIIFKLQMVTGLGITLCQHMMFLKQCSVALAISDQLSVDRSVLSRQIFFFFQVFKSLFQAFNDSPSFTHQKSSSRPTCFSETGETCLFFVKGLICIVKPLIFLDITWSQKLQLQLLISLASQHIWLYRSCFGQILITATSTFLMLLIHCALLATSLANQSDCYDHLPLSMDGAFV